MDWLKKNYPLLIVLTVAFVLRFVNLGYSDYQGDEINALFFPKAGESIASFLLDKSKGPVQYLMAGLVKLVDPSYTHRFIDRLPFALTGFLAVFFFYKLVEDNFGRRQAFYSSLFFATNGFFVAFSRIIQYQSLVLFFMLLALYLFSLSAKRENWRVKGLYFGFICWALALLSHYDGVFIAPFAFYFLYPRFKEKHFWLSLLIPGLMLAVFYIPFGISISAAIKVNWLRRIEGVPEKISNSKYLFSVYQPNHVFHLYVLSGALGGLKYIIDAIKSKKIERIQGFLGLWLLLPVIFWEGLVDIRGTHIYTYILPATIFMAEGIVFIEDTVRAAAKRFSLVKAANFAMNAGLFLVFGFISLQSYTIFVNHTSEYPWENEKFLVFTLKKPSTLFNLSLFGFPYYRHWDEIRTLVDSTPKNGYYSTNEYERISDYFVAQKYKTSQAGFYIYVLNPQSFKAKITSKRIKAWVANHDPVKVFYNESGKPVVKVYYLY
jgi:4-amino-4-deoxy-L-arabinose transferase-like glycosyltransferase